VLAHAGGLPGAPGSTDLVAIVRDTAGSITFIRVATDGTVRSRMQLAGMSYVTIAGVNTGVLARTAEHAIEWYALDGTLRGRLVAEAGQEIMELAGRRDRAAAVIRRGDDLFVRYISLGEAPRWEPMVEIPDHMKPGTFAVAPHVRRIAFADGKGNLRVYDVGLQLDAQAFPGESYFADGQTLVGFVDDDTVAVPGFHILWWTRDKPEHKPPASSPTDINQTAVPAITDSRVISAANGELVLATSTEARYLGWSVPVVGGFYFGDRSVVLSQSSTRLSWIADDLTRRGSIDLRDPDNQTWAYGQPMGSHFVVVQRPYGEHSDVEVVDIAHADKPLAILDDERVDRVVVGSSTIGVQAGTKLRRFDVALDAMTFEEQKPAISVKDYSVTWAQVFDPARANGIAAVVVSWEREASTNQTLTTYRIDRNKVIAKRERDFSGQIIRTWPDGTLAVLTSDGRDTNTITLRRGDDVIKTVVVHGPHSPVAISDDMSRLALHDDHDVYMISADGKELWRSPLWNAAYVMFSPSEQRVFASAPGGLVAFDAASGRQIGRECGFEFGVHDKPADIGPIGAPTVCEDALLQ
jgi:hypothetical protein